ncbi:uncharacterized protein LOC132202919 [Neocloeon triangulifer]|uniref:uncharacterized protein LOC132202919 n=1 Tax=Neocloeon triangulifer TaxID=2078957 RepID=UPI00286EBF78|nr:uncharacterized protein LOC132202919 [Neocloeon triangulifer]XP_059486216.1 uncharacterized protein LOC132202919 [Neocloeon triangulifer]XP_059486217.1 uncharacterized protein LOC132202919 [Neocloeon triangulifer]
MPVSLTLDKTLQDGFALGSPIGPARLGFFETDGGEQNADNVFVFVAHYDFKGGVQSWSRPGDERDVESLRETFADKRNCRFREWLSPKKEDLLALLADEQKIKRYFASEDLAPSVFILYVLSHGNEDGLIYTDKLHYLDQYDTFNAKDVFDSLQQIFPESLKFVFLGPCRGSLEDKVFNPNDGQVESKISSRVSFEPRMRNLVILYSTVETTKAKRDDAGTWLVKFSCMQLNKMRENESVVKFLTGVQNRIHLETTTFRKEGQTPEFKINPQDRKFTFSSLSIEFFENDSPRDGSDAKGAIHISEHSQPEQPRSIYFDWRNPISNKLLRGRRAVIFHQGSEKSDDIEKIDSALIKKFNFETIRVKIDNDGLNHYLSKREGNKSWEDYGCFAAFIFAEISEPEDGEICICLNENEKKPIGELIHGLLGPRNDDCIGKPKLFFFLEQQHIYTDSTLMEQKPNFEYMRATNHSGWLVCVIRDKDTCQAFLKMFEQEEMNFDLKSLQEFLGDLVVGSGTGQKVMLVSTLPHLLHFPELKRNFIEPYFAMPRGSYWNNTHDIIEYNTFIEHAKNLEMNRIWLLSSDPGSGKSTVLREIAFELQRELGGAFKVLKVDLSQITLSSSGAIRKKRKLPSLGSVVAHETGNREEDIQNWIKEEKLIVMFDGFDEKCPIYRDQVLDLFLEAIEKNVPIWISTRPHEQEAILVKFGEKNKIRMASIFPLNPNQQIELFKVTSNKDEEECKKQMNFYRKNGFHDILSNPLHLSMIAEISTSDCTKGPNLYEIYEKIVDKKMRMALKNLNQNNASFEDELVSRVKDLEKFSAEILSQCGEMSIDPIKGLTENNGLVTIIHEQENTPGMINFVHQTFAEFLAAGYYIDCLEGKTKVPFDIFRIGYHQVCKFVVMGISALKDLDLFVALLGNPFENNLEKQSIIMQIIFEENPATTFNIVKNEITFGESSRRGKFHFAVTDDILIKACEKNEEITLRLLDMGAFQSVKDPQSVTIKMLTSSIRNNFVTLFSKLEENFSKSKITLMAQHNDDIKKSVVESAARNNQQVLKLIFEKKLTNAWVFKSQILRSALENNSVETVELLIDSGASTAKLFRLEDELSLFSYHSLKVSTVEALLKTRTEHPVKLADRIFKISLSCTNFEVAKYLHDRYQGRRNQPVSFSVHKSSLLHAVSYKRGPVNIFSPEEVIKMSYWLVDEIGLNVNDKDDDGMNVLHHAVILGNLELVKYFLQKDPELVNSVTTIGENVIHLAAQFEHERLFGKRNLTVIEYLNRLNGELILKKTHVKQTALHFAAKAGDWDTCKLLVKLGVDLDAADNIGWNAAHYWAFSGNVGFQLRIIIYLHENAPQLIQQRTNDGNTLLHIAAENFAMKNETFEWLIQKGIDLRAENNRGLSAFNLAAMQGNTEFIKILLDNDRDLINSLTNAGENVMHLLTASSKELKVFEYLHQLNGDLINQKTKKNQTVLHYAAERGCLEVCQWLVDKMNVETNAEDQNGWNAMHFAATRERGALEIVQYLHHKNYRLILKKTKRNETVMLIAERCKSSGLYQWLSESGADVSLE